jgi:hypothetical protein
MIRSADSMPSAEENIVVAPKRAGLALFVDPPMVLVATDRCRRARLPVRLGRRCVVRALSKPVISRRDAERSHSSNRYNADKGAQLEPTSEVAR